MALKHDFGHLVGCRPGILRLAIVGAVAASAAGPTHHPSIQTLWERLSLLLLQLWEPRSCSACQTAPFCYCLQLCFRIGYRGSASYIWLHGQHFLNESLWLWYLSYTPFILVCNVSGSLRLRGQYSGTMTLSLGPMVLMASHPLARTHGNKAYLIWLMVWCQ